MLMKKSKIIVELCFVIMMCGFFSACGDKKTSNEANVLEVQIQNTEDTVHTENVESNIYVEKDCYFVVKDINKADKTLVDGEILGRVGDVVNTNIILVDSIPIYNAQKSKVGYTKANVECYYECTIGDWSFIIFDEGGFYVLTEELLSVAEGLEKEDTDDKVNNEVENTTPKEDDNPTYTVQEMDKTMYAKQSVNLRSGPSTDYDKVGSLRTNEEVIITGKADTGWYRITYNGGVAYVSNSYLSDTKVEVNNTSSDNDSGEYIPPVDDVIYVPIEPEPTPTLEEPTYTYTVDEVIAIVKSTLESNGIICSTDYASAEDIAEFGPDLGMGWGIVDISMTDPYTDAQLLLDGYLWDKNNLYYLEYQGVENGEVVLKTYWGTQY